MVSLVMNDTSIQCSLQDRHSGSPVGLGQSRILIKVCYKLAAAARSDYKLYFDLCNMNLAFFVSSITFEVPQLYGSAKVNISSSHVFLISY